MSFSDLLLTTPFGAIAIFVLLALAAIAAWGARPGPSIVTRLKEWRGKKASPTPDKSQAFKPEERPPASPKQEPKPAPPEPEPKPEHPCAHERQEIERLTTELAEAKKPKPPRPVTEKNVRTLLGRFRSINEVAANMVLGEARKAEPDANSPKMQDWLAKFAIFCEVAGYQKTDPEELLKLLAYSEKHQQK